MKKNNHTLHISILFLMLIAPFFSEAQDTLHLANSDKVLVDIIYLSNRVVKYTYAEEKSRQKHLMYMRYVHRIGWKDGTNRFPEVTKYMSRGRKRLPADVKTYTLQNGEYAHEIPAERRYNVALQFGGPSITGALIFDTRFGKKDKGIGLMFGGGFARYFGERHFSIPLQLNYTTPIAQNKKGWMYDAGIGATYHNYDYGLLYMFESLGGVQFNPIEYDSGEESKALYGHIDFGVRKTPLNATGLFFRFANSIIVSKHGMYFIFPSVSMGLSIKRKSH